jgi:hypothetical protein
MYGKFFGKFTGVASKQPNEAAQQLHTALDSGDSGLWRCDVQRWVWLCGVLQLGQAWVLEAMKFSAIVRVIG